MVCGRSHNCRAACGVAVAAVMLRVWCCDCCRRAPHGVACTVVAPCMVLQALSLGCIMSWSRSPCTCDHSCCCCAMWCCCRSSRHATCGVMVMSLRGVVLWLWWLLCHVVPHRCGGIVIRVGSCTVVGPGGGGWPCICRQGWW